jgi:hypothetical protein
VLDFGEQHDELVTALPADRIRGARTAQQAGRDGLEQLVAERVPERIVDVLEAIEVEVEDRDVSLVARGRADRVADAFLEEHAIRQAGEIVMLRRMRHLQRRRARLADVPEHDDRAEWVALTIVNRRDGVLDRNLGAVAPDERAVRRQLADPGRANRLRDLARGVEHLEHVEQRLIRGGLPGPAGHGLGRDIQERDVAGHVRADDAVANATERDLRPLLLEEQGLLHALALDRVAQGPHQAACIELALDEIVLRALVEGLHGERVVLGTGEHHQRGPGCRRVRATDRIDPTLVGQAEVEHDQIDRVMGEVRFRITHALDMRQLDVVGRLFAEHLAHQASVSGTVFDQENAGDCHQVLLCWGSSVLINQKSLMLFTRSSNASSCTGLLR